MSDQPRIIRLLTKKDALHRTRLDVDKEQVTLQDGEILLKINRFAITANNITYAAFGDAMQYWQFFPTNDADWGHMPVWGFADIVVSSSPGLDVGERFYGYFPMASHIRMNPVRISERGFYDGASHRQALTSAYNQYTRCSADPVYSITRENYQMLLRPLFITSFMLDDFLRDNNFFGATRLIFSSASSKTAYGTAFCLQSAKEVELVALTSSRNRSFIEGLKCYHQTYIYEDIVQMPKDRPTLYVDFSGDEALRAKIHHHFGSALVYDCFAGSAQNNEFLRKSDLPGPEPKFYFAPVQIRKRNADWGPAEVNRRFNEAQLRFIEHVRAPDHRWLEINEGRDFSDAQRVIEELCAGRTDPAQGHVVQLA